MNVLYRAALRDAPVCDIDPQEAVSVLDEIKTLKNLKGIIMGIPFAIAGCVRIGNLDFSHCK